MAILGFFFFFLNIGIKTVQIFFIYKIKAFDFCGGILLVFFSPLFFFFNRSENGLRRSGRSACMFLVRECVDQEGAV